LLRSAKMILVISFVSNRASAREERECMRVCKEREREGRGRAAKVERPPMSACFGGCNSYRERAAELRTETAAAAAGCTLCTFRKERTFTQLKPKCFAKVSEWR
jgi:hypothetical protein